LSIFNQQEIHLLQAILSSVNRSVILSEEILAILEKAFAVHSFNLSQVQQGGALMPITGVPVGGSGTFQETPDPPGSTLVGNPTFTSDHPEVTLSPSPDADPTKVVATASSTAVAGSAFNLTVSGTNTLGTAISTVFSVPILPAVPPVATGFTLTQLS
jgi:hypothetical protein